MLGPPLGPITLGIWLMRGYSCFNRGSNTHAHAFNCGGLVELIKLIEHIKLGGKRYSKGDRKEWRERVQLNKINSVQVLNSQITKKIKATG